VISVAREYLGNSTGEQVRSEVCRIPERLQQIFAAAASSARPTNEVADELARQIVARGDHRAHAGKSTAGRLIA
jgi:leucine dehydrogenase